MTAVALLLTLPIIGLGALGVASPDRLIAVVRRFQSPAGLWAAAALRLALGGALYFAAPESRAPALLRGLAVFLVVAGAITPLFGVERFGRILDWWATRGPLLLRVWAAFALAFGLALAYALTP